MVYKVNNKSNLSIFNHLLFYIKGALLSILIDPIYYTSIIIGSLYHNEHIQRALFSRIEQVNIKIKENIRYI